MSDFTNSNTSRSLPLLVDVEDQAITVCELPKTVHRNAAMCNTIIALVSSATLAVLIHLSGMGSATAGVGIVLSAASIAALLSHISQEASLGWLLTIALPFFVYGQYHASVQIETDMQGVQHRDALAATTIFFLVSLMYRKVLQDNSSTLESLWVLHLLPEVFAMSAILLTYVGEVSVGLVILLGGECVLVGCAVGILVLRAKKPAGVKSATAKHDEEESLSMNPLCCAVPVTV